MRRLLYAIREALRLSGGFTNLLRAISSHFRKTGFLGTISFATKFINRVRTGTEPQIEYSSWITRHESVIDSSSILARGKMHSAEEQPLISILMPIYNAPEIFLTQAIQSVVHQSYKNWELIVIDDYSKNRKELKAIVESFETEKIKYFRNKKNRGISETTNSAFAEAKGDLIAFMDQDDLIHKHTMLLFAWQSVMRPNKQLFYSDEDKISVEGSRHTPHLKPAYNPELMWTYNYVSHFTVVRSESFRKLNGLNSKYDGAQDYDFVLRVADKFGSDSIFHIPLVLYHWRTTQGSTSANAGAKPYTFDAAKGLLEDHLKRRRLKGSVETSKHSPIYKNIQPKLTKKPTVEVVIPTRDQLFLLKTCVEGVLSSEAPFNLLVTVVDNGSEDPETLSYLDYLTQRHGVKVMRVDEKFNYSRLNNLAVKESAAQVIVFLNNDIEIIDKNWLEPLVAHAIRNDVGCVGARLLYPDKTVQHAGVICGVGAIEGVAGHASKHLRYEDPGYFQRAVATQEFLAVTAACLVIEKQKFLDAGGFDEALAVSFNDVDLCLRVNALGYRNIFCADVELIHHESKSRGSDAQPDKIARAVREARMMRERWAATLDTDPFYSPSFSRMSENFRLDEQGGIYAIAYLVSEERKS